MLRPLLFLFGYRRLRMGISYAGEVVELCRRGGFVYRNLSFCGEHVCFDASLLTAKKIRSACEDRGIPIVSEEMGGLPALFLRYRRRVGGLIGALCFCLIVFCSGRVVWDVRVEGNRRLSDREVIDGLRVCGLRIGSVISELDTTALENRMLIESDEISWISVNLRGTVAHVEIRETEFPPEEEEFIASNLIAAEDGQIEWLEDVRGNVAVKVGDVVGKGELLVGGLYETADGTLRYARAHGKVLARTKRTFSVEIPLTYEKKVYTGEVKVEKSLIFFEKEVKFFGNSRNFKGTCDTINTVEYFELPGEVTLPVGIRTVRYLAYEIVPCEREAEKALELGLYRLRLLAEGAVPEGALVRKGLDATLTETSYRITCQAEYIENIAKEIEIEIEGLPPTSSGGKNS